MQTPLNPLPSFFRRSSAIRHFLLTLLPIVLSLSILLIFTEPKGNTPGFASAPHASAASTAPQQINIPYFGSSDVPFNQTSVFWFGKVTPTTNSIDVRIGYNDTYLYVNLNVVDQYIWYDTHQSDPNLNTGDTSTLYLDTTGKGSSAPQLTSYKFLAEIDNTEPRAKYQAGYQGDGTGWLPSTMPSTTVSFHKGKGLNGGMDSGWDMTYKIPFTSLGQVAAPASGTSWKLALIIHNQTGSTGAIVNYQRWPKATKNPKPSSWGKMVYGLPTYQPPSTTNDVTYTVQNGLNGQVVTDGMVGGGLACLNGNPANNRWTQFGIQTYPQATRVDIENEQDISDFNCFSKYYITFPLSSLPTGQDIVSATVTLYLNGNFGGNRGPNPSLIQVAAINQAWSSSRP